MKILAIETSCDETAAAVVEDGRKVLANVIASQVEKHLIFGGVVPEIASRMHVEAISGVVRCALEAANTGLDDLDAIAVTQAPGLIGALLVGLNFAKGLSFAAGLPLVPVHHLRAHIAANYLEYGALEPPFLCLVVSGGHSHIIEVRGYTEFRVLGRSRDDAAGEALDKAARALGLPYPGGLHLDRISQNGDPYAYRFPRPKVESSPYDFSFSGLKTAAVQILHNAKQRGEEINTADFGASYIQTVAEYLCDHTLLAAEAIGASTVVLAGGVAANTRLRARMATLCEQRGLRFYCPSVPLCGDNAAMVGAQGYYEFRAGHVAELGLNAFASMNIDDCETHGRVKRAPTCKNYLLNTNDIL